MRQSLPWWTAALVVASTLVLSACSSTGSTGADLDPATSELPDGVAVSVSQSRSDVVIRALQIRIENLSDDDLTVSGAVFDSPGFSTPAVWQKDSTVVGAGRTVDLPVLLSESVCADGDVAPTVTLTWSLGDGERVSRGLSEVTPTDERDRLGELGAEACFDEATASVVAFSADTPPRSVLVDGLPAVELDVTLTPASPPTDETLAIESVSGTTLFTPVDSVTGAQTASLPLDLVVDGDGPRLITLLLVPTRCDPHAVAEDKQGTIFPFSVIAPDGERGTTEGTVFVATPTAVKEALIALIAPACAARGEG